MLTVKTYSDDSLMHVQICFTIIGSLTLLLRISTITWWKKNHMLKLLKSVKRKFAFA